MSKLDGRTLDIEKQNIEKLKELFPEVDTDGKIDFEKLKQVLGEYVEDSKERYKFTWNGKGEALRLSQTPSTGTLRPAPEESKNWDNTENLYIEGDNLEVLKLLQKSYFGKIKMIYIDPPYNTGKDFVYPDNYKDNIKNYKRLTGQVDEDGKATSTNKEYSGRYHTDWLNMMYPRLRLARNLLTEDGVIFISIDDNEVHNLRKICDEVFGEDNFINLLPTITNLKGNQDEFGFAGTHEYTIVFSKNENQAKINYFKLSEKEIEEDWEIDVQGYYKIGANLKATGVNAPRNKRPNLYFPIYILHDNKIALEQPKAYKKEIFPMTNDREMSWRWSKERFTNHIDDVIVKDNNDNISLYKKQRSNSGNIPSKKAKTLFYKPEYSSGNGTNEMNDLFGFRLFNNPKSLIYIRDILELGTDKDSYILDFFAGSSTTAHAVMNLNAEDGGNRKYIMVQLPEPTDEKPEVYKAGYKNIAEIGKERIRRAGDKIKAELEEKYKKASEEERKNMKNPDQLDIGFKVFKLDSSNIKEWNPGRYDDIQLAIEDASNPYVEERTQKDVVYEMMLKMGLDLTYPVEQHEVNGKVIYSIGYGLLMICLSEGIDLSIANKMIEIKDANKQDEFRVIFRDGGFNSDTEKTNIKETLKAAGLAEESFITL